MSECGEVMTVLKRFSHDYRQMLSAAHILAMNAKNLLDVIDSIRMRYPYVNNQICQKQNDVNVPQESTPEARIRSSQSGEQFLRRSQSTERQGTTFRQSQSGDLLHRMGQSVDRSLQVNIPALKQITDLTSEGQYCCNSRCSVSSI